MGVLQGGVLSPILFNFYISLLPPPPPGIHLISYADDCTSAASGVNVEETPNRINNYLSQVAAFFHERKLLLNSQKSSATLFTTWTKEVNDTLEVYIDDERVPTVKYPKILVVTFDNLQTFAKQSANVCKSVSSRNRALKALAGTSWGKDKETIVSTYKTSCRSVINCCAPVWTPFLSDTQWSKIQTRQNSALRIATGCHSITHPDHLHDETSMLPVKAHNELLTKQFLLSCHDPQHPNYEVANREMPSRSIRSDFRIFSGNIANYIPNPIYESTLSSAKNTMHRDSVRSVITSSSVNRVLGSRPPQVDPSEKSLPRETRTVLAQLRSGFSNMLKNYRARIIPSEIDACPTAVADQQIYRLTISEINPWGRKKLLPGASPGGG